MKYTLLILSIFLFSCQENLNETFSTTKQNEVVGKFDAFLLNNEPADNPMVITKINDTLYKIKYIYGSSESKLIKKGDTLFNEHFKDNKNLYYIIDGDKLYNYYEKRKQSYYKKSKYLKDTEASMLEQEKLRKEKLLQEMKEEEAKSNEEYQKLLNKKITPVKQ
jgi:hypothetical protein